MKLTIYIYDKCSTCRKALKFLDTLGVNYEKIAIRDHPPTKAELRSMLAVYDGELKRLFNTSGQDYRQLGIKDRLAKMSEAEAIDLLASNGNLIKRPFAIAETGKSIALVGFKEELWNEALAKA